MGRRPARDSPRQTYRAHYSAASHGSVQFGSKNKNCGGSLHEDESCQDARQTCVGGLDMVERREQLAKEGRTCEPQDHCDRYARHYVAESKPSLGEPQVRSNKARDEYDGGKAIANNIVGNPKSLQVGRIEDGAAPDHGPEDDEDGGSDARSRSDTDKS